jgi:type I restriction enzyme S subunit
MREGWLLDSLSNCIKLKSGDGLTAKKMISGEFPVFGGNGVAGYHNDFNLSGENVIIGRVGALCGNSRHINEKIWLTDNAFKVSEFKYDFDLEFLNYLLNHVELRSYARQAAQPVISNSSLKNVILSFPKLLEEQKQIVAILNKAFTAIDQAKANIDKNIVNAKELFQSKLNDIFSQKGVGWEEKSLSEVCDIRPPKKLAKEKLKDSDLVSFVPMKYLKVNQMYFNSEETKPLEQAYSGYVYFEEGDVVLAKITPCFENGKLGIAKDLENGIGFGSSEYVVYRVDKNKLSAEFLYFFLNRGKFRIKGKSLMSGAVGHKRIQPNFYENEIIYLPNLTVQNNILDSITTLQINVNQIESNYNKKIEDLVDLKKSVLQKAFAGELTQK